MTFSILTVIGIVGYIKDKDLGSIVACMMIVGILLNIGSL